MLSTRSDESELLDAPGVSDDDIRTSLADMARINRWLGGSAALRSLLLPALRSRGEHAEIRLLDAGCGGGGTSRWVAARSPSGASWRITGVDQENRHLKLAAGPADLASGDLTCLPFRDGAFDFAFSTLTLHHLPPAALAQALRELGRVTRRLVVLNDLVRSQTALAAFAALAPVFARNHVTRLDGPASVRRAYAPAELAAIAAQAGCRNPRIVRHRLYFRMSLVFDGGAL